MIIPFESSAVKDRRLWLMYSICSAPSDSNPDWCQLSGIILFAPHPFYATISPSIPSYSTVTPNVTLIHPPIPPTTSLGFQIQCLLKLQSGSQSWMSARTKGFPLFFEPHSHFLFHVFSLLYMQASDYNIFEGLECRGGPALVLSQGRVVYEEGNLQVQQGTGRFIPRKQFPDYAYQRVKCRNQVWNTHLLVLQYSPLRFSAILSVYFANLCIKIYIFLYFGPYLRPLCWETQCFHLASGAWSSMWLMTPSCFLHLGSAHSGNGNTLEPRFMMVALHRKSYLHSTLPVIVDKNSRKMLLVHFLSSWHTPLAFQLEWGGSSQDVVLVLRASLLL